MIIILLAVFGLMILYEVPGLVKRKLWKELIAFSVLMAVAIVISVLQYLDIEIPNPVRDSQLILKSLIPFSYD